MTLVERIRTQRINASKHPIYSDEWYTIMAYAAELTREWRIVNTLASVPV